MAFGLYPAALFGNRLYDWIFAGVESFFSLAMGFGESVGLQAGLLARG
jgi:hypothetical protein